MVQISRTNRITFKEDELVPERTGHVKSLHIAVEFRRMIISKVLINNGAALGDCLAMTLSRKGFKDSMFRPKGMMVRAFNGTKTSTCGEIDHKILVVSYELKVFFAVVDILVIFF